VAALVFLGIRIAADYISRSRHYVIDFDKRPETNPENKLSNDELMEVIEKTQDVDDGKRATKGLPVLVDDLNFNQENKKIILTTDEVDYGLNQLSEAGKIIRYKNLIASAKSGYESIGAYYLYELAMKENSHQIDSEYKKMLKANNIMPFQSVPQWEKEAHTVEDSDMSILTLGMGEANTLRKRMYSYDTRGGYLLFLLSNGMIKCIEA
jgi:hypothetical protein